MSLDTAEMRPLRLHDRAEHRRGGVSAGRFRWALSKSMNQR